MKKVYKKPMAYEEVFITENYCTVACYKIACNIHNHEIPKESWHKHQDYFYDKSNHSGWNGRGCLSADLNRILVNSDGTLKSVEEYSERGGGANNGNGWMAGEFDHADSNVLKPGVTVYWSTYRADRNTGWNHYGTIQQVDPNHPNHS